MDNNSSLQSSVWASRRRLLLVDVVMLVSFLLLAVLPSFSSAQRVAPLGSRLKKRFSGGKSGSGGAYKNVQQQGEDAEDAENSLVVLMDWMQQGMIREMMKRPGLAAVGFAFVIGYIYLFLYQARLSEIERKLHRNFKRQLSTGGELRHFSLMHARQFCVPATFSNPRCSFLSIGESARMQRLLCGL
jgi:hypothetical protein